MNNQAPGQLPTQANPDVVMMICTAGHVDHGKTLLVTMLTGCQTDRLKEEIERGMTIELGFAPCYLGNNLSVGIVDVPGHEKLVKTMVSGVSGIGMTLLVIAADDGLMPQTIEHVQIMELLGVRRGLVALTKIDLVTPERVRQCREDIRAFLAGTFLAQAPICPLSSKTFEGFDAFYETLAAEISRVAQQPQSGVFRMPIERVFTLTGLGTIVSGIPIDGAIQVGAQVELVPGHHLGRVRGIQRFLRDAAQGGCGQCLALNIPEFNKITPQRGQVLCLPDHLQTARCFHARLRLAPGLKKPLDNAELVKFHSGTIEETGKLYWLDPAPTQSGTAALASIVLENPVAIAVRDRFILRRPSPPTTVAGGEVLAISYTEQRPRKAVLLPQLQAQEAFFAGTDPATPQGMERRIEWHLLRERKWGASAQDICRGILLPAGVVPPALARLCQAQKIIALSDDNYIHADVFRASFAEVEARIQRASQDDQALTLTLGELRRDLDWPAPLWNRLEAELQQRRNIQRRGDKLLLPTTIDQLPADERAVAERMLRLYEESGFHSPRPEELPELLKTTPARSARLLDYLASQRLLIHVAPNVVLSAGHFKQAQTWW